MPCRESIVQQLQAIAPILQDDQAQSEAKTCTARIVATCAELAHLRCSIAVACTPGLVIMLRDADNLAGQVAAATALACLTSSPDASQDTVTAAPALADTLRAYLDMGPSGADGKRAGCAIPPSTPKPLRLSPASSVAAPALPPANEDTEGPLAVQAASALANLASVSQHRGFVFRVAGQVLTTLLGQQRCPRVQVHAARALALLTSSPNCLPEGSACDTIPPLVALVRSACLPEARAYAAFTLTHLAQQAGALREAIVQTGLGPLVSLLSDRNNPAGCKHAARAIGSLAAGCRKSRERRHLAAVAKPALKAVRKEGNMDPEAAKSVKDALKALQVHSWW